MKSGSQALCAYTLSQALCAYTFAPEQIKPYVRALAPLGGENVLRDSPLDHKHPEIKPADFLTNRGEYWTARLQQKNP